MKILKGCLIVVLALVAIQMVVMFSASNTKQPGPPAAMLATPTPVSAAEAARRAEQARKNEAAAKLKDAQFLASPAGRLCSQHTGWSRDDCDTISKRMVHMGMTAEQVRLAWGKPNKVNSTVTASGTNEQWVWEGRDQYAYFDDGILTSIQQSR